MSDLLTKTQAQMAFAAAHKYALQWTSHKPFCKRLRAEVLGEAELPPCTCGYFVAIAQLETDLSQIRCGTKTKKGKKK